MAEPFNYQDYVQKMNNPPPYADLTKTIFGDFAGVGGDNPSDFGRLLNWMQGQPNPPYGRTQTALPAGSAGVGRFGYLRNLLKDIAGSGVATGGSMPMGADSSATGLKVPAGEFSRGPNVGLKGRMDTGAP